MDSKTVSIALFTCFALVACGDEKGRTTDSDSAVSVTGVTGVTGVSGATDASGTSDASTLGASEVGTSPTTTEPVGPTTGDACGGCPQGQECDPEFAICVPKPCTTPEDCGPGLLCNGGLCGEECGAQEFEITKLAPNLMILLDRSGSMDGEIDGVTRWDVAKQAIGELIAGFDMQLRFGLSTYSSCTGNGCSAGTIVVPIADNNGANVVGFLADKLGQGSGNGDAMTNGGIAYLCDSGDPETSTGKSLKALVGEPSLQDAQRSNAVLLVTDGAESGDCTNGGQDNGVAGATALFGQAVPVQTYVVGFTQDVNPDALNAVAQAGGTMVYYQADNLEQLKTAFDQIAASVASCDYVLGQPPADLEEMYVFFNDDPQAIPQDPGGGWVYDPATMTLKFVGAACEQIKSGQVTDIDVVFGCGVPIPG